MTALVPRRAVTRDAVRITIPHAECEAKGCDSPIAADLVWHDQRAGALHLLKVCGWHAFALKGQGPAVIFPLGAAPSLDLIVRWMQQEVARRRPPAPTVRMTFNAGYSWGTNTTSGTFTGNWGYFR